MTRLVLPTVLLMAFFSTGVANAQQAAHFDVPGAYLEVPHDSTLATPEFSIEFWLRVRELGNPEYAGGEQTLFDKRGDQGSGYNFRLAGDRFPLPVFAFAEAGGIDAFDAVPQNVWVHLAITHSTDSLKIYRNGLLASADTNAYTLVSTAPLRIGEFGGFPGAYIGLRGDMDEIRIWDHARPADSILWNVHTKLSGAESGLVAYWDFENESDRRIPDLSPNGNDAEMWGDVKLIPSDAPIGYDPPPAPTGLRAFGSTTSIKLAWLHDAAVTGYDVFRGSEPGFLADSSTLLASVPGSDSSYTDFGVVPDYNYYYRLRAVDTDGRPSPPGVEALGRVVVETDYLTGVYYLPSHDPEDSTRAWDGAYHRAFLDPPQPPLLGHYSSRDTDVIRQHLDWMEAYGIDFLVSNWWQQGSWEDVTLRDFILPEIESTSVRFSLLYLIDNFWGESGLVVDAQITQQILEDFEYFADTYLGHPNMLTVEGRPVIFLYGTRHLQGDFVNAFSAVRSAMADRGFDVFLVGDEFRWGVTEPDHFQILDAVSPYLMGTWRYRGSYLGHTEYFADLSLMAGLWEDTAHPFGKYVIPSVTPGVNGIYRGGTVATPRRILPEPGAMTALEGQIRQLRPFVDPYLKIIMVATWNDWAPDRQIEPTVVAEGTTSDISSTGSDYTMGFTYEGYGTLYLEIIRDLLAPELLVGFDDSRAPAPAELILYQNYPNPVGVTSTIAFDLPSRSHVTLTLFDILGRRIRVLEHSVMAPGRRRSTVSAAGLPSGVYYYRLRTETQTRTRRMVVVRS